MRDRQTIEKLVAAGKTPFYLFDEATLANRIEHVRSLMPEGTRICYAMKANSFILDAASRASDLIEVCSPGELETCRALGVPDELLVISGVYKEPALMRELIASKSAVHRYTAESVSQFELLEEAARETGACVPILLRLTSGNQFGMDASDLRRILDEQRDGKHVRICGIQYFSGTQKRSAKRIRRELSLLDKLIAELADDAIVIDELEYGTGIPVDYCEPDETAAAKADRAFLEGLADALAQMDFSGTKILEIGRGIAACCGTYVTRVVDTKANKGNHYAITDGGKHQLVYYGQTLALRPPVAHFLPDRSGEGTTTWTICGALCTAGDTLVAQVALNDLQVGDCVVFPNAGAYSMTEGMSLFLSRDLPRIYLKSASGTVTLVRDRMETSAVNTPAPLN